MDIFGQDYTLKSEAEDGHIQRVADLVDRKMREVSMSTNSKNTVNIAILAALNMADEYLRIKDDRDRAAAKTRDLMQLVDGSL